MTVIIPAVVAHHANWLMTLIDNSDPGPVGLLPPATVKMDGLTASFEVADNDTVYDITIRPRTATPELIPADPALLADLAAAHDREEAEQAQWREMAEDDPLANINDPPSPAAGLIERILTDAAYDPEETCSLRFGDIADTNPAGIGEAAVHVLDQQVNAEFLLIAVPWRTAEWGDGGTDIAALGALWADLTARAAAHKAGTAS